MIVSKFRVVETSKGFEIQQDQGKYIYISYFGSFWDDNWATLEISKTLKDAAKKVKAYRIKQEGIIHNV